MASLTVGVPEPLKFGSLECAGVVTCVQLCALFPRHLLLETMRDGPLL